MFLWSGLKILLRAAAGKPPCQRDLDEMVVTLRRRLLAEQGLRPPGTSWLSPQFMQNRLRAFQLRKLRRTVAYVGEHVPYYRRVLRKVGVQAGDIRSLASLQKIPLTRRVDFENHKNDFVSQAPGLTASIVLSSTGTSGKPLDTFLTPEEFDRYTSLQAIAGLTYGFLGPRHIVQVHLPFDSSAAAKIYNVAAFKSGALVLTPGLNGKLDDHLDSLLLHREVPGKFPQVSVLFGAPGFIWALASRSRERGLHPTDFGLKRVFASGAKVSAELKARVLETWGVRLFEGYSLVELVSTGAYECDHGRMHFLDFSGIVEFLDPQTHQPVLPGQPGVAVITSLYPDRQLMPFLRYWTNDLVLTSSESLCSCGLVTTPIAEILGRSDHMVIVGQQNFYPQSVGDALTVFPELVRPPRFQIRTEERSESQHVVLEVEHAAPLDAAARHQLAEKIRHAVPLSRATHVLAGVVKCAVQLVPAGSIARPFPYKLQGPLPV